MESSISCHKIRAMLNLVSLIGPIRFNFRIIAFLKKSEAKYKANCDWLHEYVMKISQSKMLLKFK